MAMGEAGCWLKEALLHHPGVQMDADTVASLASYCDRASPVDATEYLANIIGSESCKDIVPEYLSRRAATGTHEADDHVERRVMKPYMKSQTDEVWSSSAKKVSKPKTGPAKSQQDSISCTSKDVDQSGSGKRGGRRIRKGGRGMSLAEAAEGRILMSSGTPCNCQATRHKLVNNCLSCGKIVCEQEGEGQCKFCGALVLRDGSNYAGLEGISPPFSEAEAAAHTFKDRLVEYDRNSAQRTTVIDDQSDYFQIDSDAWLSEEEKQLLYKRQEELKKAEEARRRKVVVTIDLLGRKVVMAGDTDTDLEMKTGILGGTHNGEKYNIPRMKANPYISEAPIFVDVTPHEDTRSRMFDRNSRQLSAPHSLANSGRVQHDDPFVEAISSSLVKYGQTDSSWQIPRIKGNENFCDRDEVCFQESTTSSTDDSSLVFDICQDEMYESTENVKPVVLSPSTLIQMQSEMEKVSDGGEKGFIIRPGMVLLRNWLTKSDQLAIVKICRTLGIGKGGFFRPGYGDRNKMHLWMMCLGKHWEPTTRAYEQKRSFDNAVPPAIPPMFIDLAKGALTAAQHLIRESRESSMKYGHSLLPDMEPDICLVNFYKYSGTLGMHQDRDEDPESLQKGIPVVSFSIGDSADFLYGTERGAEKAACVRLKSADVLVFGGPSRLIFHGVQRILPQTSPSWLQKEASLRPGRLNLTFRQFHT